MEGKGEGGRKREEKLPVFHLRVRIGVRVRVGVGVIATRCLLRIDPTRQGKAKKRKNKSRQDNEKTRHEKAKQDKSKTW